jgi:hypothetical protein
MAIVLQLTDGTTTVDLNDGSIITARTATWTFPRPPIRRSASGGNLSRHGGSVTAKTYANRIIAGQLVIDGSSTGLETTFGKIEEILRKAREYELTGAGSRVQLKFQRTGGTIFFFDIVDGDFDAGPESYGPALTVSSHTFSAIRLEAKPFATSAAETIENYALDPSFEVAGTALADWNEDKACDICATGTRVTTHNKFGAASLRINVTDSVGATRRYNRQMHTKAASFAAGDTVSAGVWMFVTAFNDMTHFRLRIQAHNAGHGGLGSIINNEVTAVQSDWTHIKIENQTAPSLTDHYLVMLEGIAGAANATGNAYFDGVYIGKGATVPTTWISGRDVANHFDDNGQDHINYIDIYCTPGEVPAKLQVKAYENEAHNAFWAGARQAGRMTDSGLYHEGEGFTGLACCSNALSSAGKRGSVTVNNCETASSPLVVTKAIATPPVGTYKVLSRITTSANCFLSVGMGFSYGGITQDPSVASEYVDVNAGACAVKIYDLGHLTIPPTTTPENQTTGTYTLRMAAYNRTGTNRVMYVDWVHLLPVDLGYGVIGSKTSSRDVVMLDSESEIGAVSLLDTSSVIQSYPANQFTNPPNAHPEGTRISMVADDGCADIADGWKVAVRITPQYLDVI